MKDLEWEKGQLSSWPPVPYIPPTDLVTTKEEPQILKMKLPDGSVFNMSIYSRGNTKEYLAHIVAVLHIIKQKGLNAQCRKLGKAVVKLTRMFKDLLKAAGSKDTVLLDDDVEAHKFEIKETQKMLQEAKKQHNEAVAKTYKLLRNLLSGDLQSQWDCVCHEMHECDSWEGIHAHGLLSKTVLSCISSRSSLLMKPKGSSSTLSRRYASPKGPLCDSISREWECLMTMSDTSPR